LRTTLLAQAESLCELADRTRRLAQSLSQPADQVKLYNYEKELRNQADLLIAEAHGRAEPVLLLVDPLPSSLPSSQIDSF
jgi:hypothetical protein